jgi:hypothetical protein
MATESLSMSGSKMREWLSRRTLLRAGLAGSIRQQARQSWRAFLQRGGCDCRDPAKFKNAM